MKFIIVFLLSCSIAKADTIYSFSASTTYGPYGGCSISEPCALSGTMDFVQPLSPGMALASIVPESWSFLFPHRAGAGNSGACWNWNHNAVNSQAMIR